MRILVGVGGEEEGRNITGCILQNTLGSGPFSFQNLSYTHGDVTFHYCIFFLITSSAINSRLLGKEHKRKGIKLFKSVWHHSCIVAAGDLQNLMFFI